MKTTVKDFILDNLTDKNFEKLVNTLISNKIWYYHSDDDELIAITSNYLSDKNLNYSKNNTFEILNEIKKVSKVYITDYTESLLGNDDLKTVNDTSMSWMPSESSPLNKLKNVDYTSREEIEAIPHPILEDEEELELEVNSADLPFGEEEGEEAEDHARYFSLQDMKTALIPEGYAYSNNDLFEITVENYKEVLYIEKIETALKLANFIYEVLHYSNESKMDNNSDEFSNETTHVKIADSHEYKGDYAIFFLLDHRSRYASAEIRKAFSDRGRTEFIDDNGVRYYEDLFHELGKGEPEFLEYSILIEDLEFGPEYILAPFTFYLNEDLFVPNVSDDALYEILGQLIQVLTFQGFRKEEQISTIKYYNESYFHNIV